MKIAIVYKSITGNTKLLAEAIKEEIPTNQLVYFGEPKENIQADLYIIGSWTDKGMCATEIADFMKSIKNSKVAYFGTAGFGGSEEYFNRLFERIKTNIDDSNKILGEFFCQGKMPMQVKDRYVNLIKEHPDDKNLKVSIENFDKALTHPDKNDIQNAKEWVKNII